MVWAPTLHFSRERLSRFRHWWRACWWAIRWRMRLALPPATPFGYSLLRASLCAAHTEEQLDEVIAIFAEVATSLGLIEPHRKRLAAG